MFDAVMLTPYKSEVQDIIACGPYVSVLISSTKRQIVLYKKKSFVLFILILWIEQVDPYVS